MKSQSILILFLGLSSISVFSQPDTIDYFGQDPPGDSAVLFAPGTISRDNRYEGGLTFSPDGKVCLLNIFDGSNWQWADIYYSEYDTSWSNFAKAEFIETSKYLDIQPKFSPDGNTLYYSSLYPYKGYSLLTIFVDIWKIDRDSSGWKEPEKLNEVINTPNYDDTSPTVTSDGTLYFGKDQTRDIWYSKPEDGEYKNLINAGKPINSGSGDGQPYIAPDGSYMILSSNRDGGFGQSDLYISYRNEDETWANPKNLGSKINSGEREQGPGITPDGKYLFFNRFERGSYSDIYWVNTDFIENLKYTNFTPYTLNPIPDQIVTVGDSYNYTIPDTTFFDDDGNETIGLTVSSNDDSDLPDSLVFNQETNSISGKLTEAGNYYIKVTATDNEGASVSDTYWLKAEQSTGVHDNKLILNNIILYPNPANKTINISSGTLLLENTSYRITDMRGKIMKTGILDKENIDVSELSEGVYLFVLKMNGQTVSKKFMIYSNDN